MARDSFVQTPPFTRARSGEPLPDVLVIGGGIIGCALARELAIAGARVTVLERGRLGCEASSAAAGMLGPQAECDARGPLLELGIASRALYPETVAALREETGIDAEYDGEGIVYVALDAADEQVLADRAAWQRRAGLRVERVDAGELRRLEPALAPEIRVGFHFPDDHRIDNVRLTRAYAVAVARLGVTVRPGEPVRRLRCEGGRVVGVEVTGGTVFAGAVVLAAGAWAAELQPAGSPLPVRPVRGQMVMLTALRPPFRHAIYSRRVYLVPRRDGRLLVGSTYEEAGFDKRVTAEAVATILARALAVAPSLTAASFSASWAGLRPGTPDALPILGAASEIGGLYYATGHYRNGILLAPATARALREVVLGERPSYDLEPFAATRFGSAARKGE